MHFSISPIRSLFGSCVIQRRYIFLTLAFFLYALWGSPTPNNPDWVEIFIGAFLFFAVGWSAIAHNFLWRRSDGYERWEMAAKVFLFYGIFISCLIAVMRGNDTFVILRDLVAFIFLMLPLFFKELVTARENSAKIFLALCLGVGLIFSIRVLVPHFLLFRNTTELLYLANSPLVLMSALYFTGMAVYLVFKGTNKRNVQGAVLLMVLSVLPILAMFVDLQRASFAALVITAVSLGTMGWVKAPLKMILPSLVVIVLVLIFSEYFSNLAHNVGHKTSQVGLNMRLQELMAVWGAVSVSPFSIFFGLGWGSVFASPAVGELNVTYTHSLLTYVFLKMGLAGLFLCLVYLYFIFEKLVKLYLSHPVKGNALIWSFIIPVFLYASHKSFDFGVLLCLILCCAEQRNNERNKAAS